MKTREEIWELVQECYQKRGYAVAASRTPRRIGEVVTTTHMRGGTVSLPQPFRIVSETDHADWHTQQLYLGLPDATSCIAHFYRVMTD